tara:strand:+ start:189 stop:623 length:435 start_codon:yes stop_codon:yes gene_type:complete
MHIVQPIATAQDITIVPRSFVYSSEDLDLYFLRVEADGGTLEGIVCVQSALNVLDRLTVYLTDESTNTTATISPTVTEAKGYMTLNYTYSVIEGTFYTIKVVLGSTVIYRGRVFCTSQTDLAQYTVNENQYVTEDSYNNEFIVL